VCIRSQVYIIQWPRRLRRRSAAACLLRLWVRIPPGTWISICCELSGRVLCEELISHPEESYRLWCVVVCDLETSRMRRPWPTGVCHAKNKQTNKGGKVSEGWRKLYKGECLMNIELGKLKKTLKLI